MLLFDNAEYVAHGERLIQEFSQLAQLGVPKDPFEELREYLGDATNAGDITQANIGEKLTQEHLAAIGEKSLSALFAAQADEEKRREAQAALHEVLRDYRDAQIAVTALGAARSISNRRVYRLSTWPRSVSGFVTGVSFGRELRVDKRPNSDNGIWSDYFVEMVNELGSPLVRVAIDA